MRLPSEVEPWAVEMAKETIFAVHTFTLSNALDIIAYDLMTAYHRGMEAAYREMNERGKS